MTRLIPLVMIFGVILTACGGGGSGSEGNTSSPAQKTNSIIATWFYEYPNQCVETFEFNADGSFRILSAEAVIAGTYDFDSTTNSRDRHALTLTFEQQNQKYDCEGAYENIVGSYVELFADFSANQQMNWFELNTGGTAIFELEREVKLEISDLPSLIQVGTEITFTVSADTGTTAPITLLYGPTGMEIDVNGQVTWTPVLPMISESNTVNFAFTSERVVVPSVVQANVSMNNFKPPTLRQGFAVAYTSNGMQIGNFIGDNDNEILILDRLGNLSIVEANGEEYESTFTYPYSLKRTSELSRLSVFDTNEDGVKEAFVMADSKILHVENLSLPPVIKLQSDQLLKHFIIDNIDSDPAPEVVVLESEFFGTHQLVVYDDDFNSVLFRADIEEGYNVEMFIGNVDNDESKEVVLSTGEVYDIRSGERQWFEPKAFHYSLTVEDLDNDGIDEVIASSQSTQVIVWNIQSNTQIAVLENDSCYGPVAVANLDTDPEKEIMIGNCGWGYINAFDLSDGSYNKRWYLKMIGSSEKGFAIGDVNNDGQDEMIWGAGTESTAEDKLVVASLTPELKVTWFSNVPSQLTRHAPAGWAQINPTEEAAVFVIPTIWGGQRYALMTEQGKVSVSNEITSNLTRLNLGIIGDSNGDGHDELFSLGADLHDTRLDIINLDGGIIQEYVQRADSDGDISTFAIADLNGDSNDDVISVKQEKLTLYDVSNDTVIDTWTAERRIISVLATTDTQGNQVIVLSTYERVHFLSLSSGELSLRASSTEVYMGNCNKLISAPRTDEVTCLGNGNYDQITKLSLDGSPLSSVDMDQFELMDAVQAPHSKNVFALVESNRIDRLATETYIVEIDTDNGTLIWQSSAIAGKARLAGYARNAGSTNKNAIIWGKVDTESHSLLISTDAGMMITH